MKKLARALRMAGYVFILLLAAFAVGLTGNFLPITSERYRNKRTSTEQVDKKWKQKKEN